MSYIEYEYRAEWLEADGSVGLSSWHHDESFVKQRHKHWNPLIRQRPKDSPDIAKWRIVFFTALSGPENPNLDPIERVLDNIAWFGDEQEW